MDSSSSSKFSKPTAFLKNVSYDATEADVESIFKGLSVSNVKISRDSRTGQPKGIAHVEFNDQESLDAAINLNGTLLHGRNVTIDVARQMEKKHDGGGAFTSSSTSGNGSGRFNSSFTSSKSDQHSLTAYVSGLIHGTTEGDIETFFEGIKIVKTQLYHDKETGEFKGVAFVEFSNTTDLESAVTRNGNSLLGSTINVSISGKKQRNNRGNYAGGNNNNFNNNNNYNNNNNSGFQYHGKQNASRIQDPDAFAAFNKGKGRKPSHQNQSTSDTSDQQTQKVQQNESTESAESSERPKLQLKPRSVDAPLNSVAVPTKNVSYYFLYYLFVYLIIRIIRIHLEMQSPLILRPFI